MQYISSSELTELVQHTSPHSVSLYIPTDRKNSDPRINSVAFKNVVNKALERIKALDLKDETYTNLDKACEQLLADKLFWKEQDQSFALFVANDFMRSYKLPTSQPELLMINDAFYILPLAQMLQLQDTFYVLELDKEHTKMWKGNNLGVEPVPVPNLPESVEEVTGTEVNERNLQFHTRTDSPKGNVRNAMFHGSSSWKDDKDRYLEKFLQAVDKAVTAYFKESTLPLLLSGVEELTVLFRKTTKLANILEENLVKVDDPNRRPELLHQAAMSVLAAHRHDRLERELTRFTEEPRQEKRVTVLPEILRQAAQGKVDTLYVAESGQVWGTFDPESMTALIENEQLPLSTELLNLAARITLTNSGSVVVVPNDKMPENSLAAALLRY